jgi:hypothetical protein
MLFYSIFDELTYYLNTDSVKNNLFKINKGIQTEVVFTLAKNATKPNPFKIISLQTTRKKNNRKTEETLARTVVTLETERINHYPANVENWVSS